MHKFYQCSLLPCYVSHSLASVWLCHCIAQVPVRLFLVLSTTCIHLGITWGPLLLTPRCLARTLPGELFGPEPRVFLSACPGLADESLPPTPLINEGGSLGLGRQQTTPAAEPQDLRTPTVGQ